MEIVDHCRHAASTIERYLKWHIFWHKFTKTHQIITDLVFSLESFSLELSTTADYPKDLSVRKYFRFLFPSFVLIAAPLIKFDEKDSLSEENIWRISWTRSSSWRFKRFDWSNFLPIEIFDEKFRLENLWEFRWSSMKIKLKKILNDQFDGWRSKSPMVSDWPMSILRISRVCFIFLHVENQSIRFLKFVRSKIFF